jgi:hypothetical protein
MKIEITQEELSELKQVQRNVTGGADCIKITGILCRFLYTATKPWRS